jgi:hypothetical protein
LLERAEGDLARIALAPPVDKLNASNDELYLATIRRLVEFALSRRQSGMKCAPGLRNQRRLTMYIGFVS